MMTLEKSRALIGLVSLLLVLSWPTPSYAQEDPVAQGREHTQQAVQAYQNGDYAGAARHFEQALAFRPNHPALVYNLAATQARLGKHEAALRGLEHYAAMGLVAAPDDDENFEALRTSSAFQAVLKTMEENRQQVGHSDEAFTLPQKGLLVEGVAYDPASQRFFVGSVHRRKVLEVEVYGAVTTFVDEGQDGLWGVFGMRVDAARRHLWVASGTVEQMQGPKEPPRTGIFKYDLDTGALVKRYLLPESDTLHLFGDLVVDAEGTVYITDSRHPAIYWIPSASDRLEVFVEGAPFSSLQGIDLSSDGRFLFVADYARGIYRIDRATRHADLLPQPAHHTLLGIDGLYVHHNSLIAIQNGVRPFRVLRIPLAAESPHVEVLEANHPHFGEPTLGVVVGDVFYYVANSQWANFGADGPTRPVDELPHPIVLKRALTADQ